MTLATLKSVCAAYHEVATSDLTVNGVDLFLVAANNVRRNKGELLHNFEYARCVATLSVNGVSGGSLDSAVIAGDSAASEATVSGTLTPDATGVYTRLGTVNGFPFYFLAQASVTYFLYHTLVSSDNDWVIATTTPLDAAPANCWAGPVGLDPSDTYTAVGAYTGSPIVVGGTSRFSKIKEVVAVSRMRPDGTYLPLDFTRADIPIERDRYELEMSDSAVSYQRYPSDAYLSSGGSNSSVIQRGRSLAVFPHNTITPNDIVSLLIEAYGLLRDYTAADLLSVEPTDFFVEYGAAFMQWSIIDELNYLFKSFVTRQEGNVASPTQKAADAWRDLLLWDTYMVDANSTRSR